MVQGSCITNNMYGCCQPGGKPPAYALNSRKASHTKERRTDKRRRATLQSAHMNQKSFPFNFIRLKTVFFIFILLYCQVCKATSTSVSLSQKSACTPARSSNAPCAEAERSVLSVYFSPFCHFNFNLPHTTSKKSFFSPELDEVNSRTKSYTLYSPFSQPAIPPNVTGSKTPPTVHVFSSSIHFSTTKCFSPEQTTQKPTCSSVRGSIISCAVDERIVASAFAFPPYHFNFNFLYATSKNCFPSSEQNEVNSRTKSYTLCNLPSHFAILPRIAVTKSYYTFNIFFPSFYFFTTKCLSPEQTRLETCKQWHRWINRCHLLDSPSVIVPSVYSVTPKLFSFPFLFSLFTNTRCFGQNEKPREGLVREHSRASGGTTR